MQIIHHRSTDSRKSFRPSSELLSRASCKMQVTIRALRNRRQERPGLETECSSFCVLWQRERAGHKTGWPPTPLTHLLKTEQGGVPITCTTGSPWAGGSQLPCAARPPPLGSSPATTHGFWLIFLRTWWMLYLYNIWPCLFCTWLTSSFSFLKVSLNSNI